MKNRLVPVTALCAAISIVGLVAQSAEKNPLVGVWEVKVSAGGVPPPALLSIAIFGEDGSFITNGNTKISVQDLADERGPGYGRCGQTSDKEFKLTFYAPLLKAGEVKGYQRVSTTMVLSGSGNEFTSSQCRVDFLDATWKLIDSDNDEIKGTRLETP